MNVETVSAGILIWIAILLGLKYGSVPISINLLFSFLAGGIIGHGLSR